MKKIVIEKIAALMAAAFGLVAALAWNDAIKAIFVTIFGEQSNIPAMLIYAVLVTIVAVIAIIYIGKIEAKTKN